MSVVSVNTGDVRNIIFIFVRFQFGLKKLGFCSEWILFGSFQKTQFVSDIIVIYYSCIRWVVNLQ